MSSFDKPGIQINYTLTVVIPADSGCTAEALNTAITNPDRTSSIETILRKSLNRTDFILFDETGVAEDVTITTTFTPTV